MNPRSEIEQLTSSTVDADAVVRMLEKLMGRAATYEEHADLLLVAHQIAECQRRWRMRRVFAEARELHDVHTPAKTRSAKLLPLFGALQGRQGLRGGRP